jgi:hypothetical protein
MAYTKDNALHDRIDINGVDVSNAFRSFSFSSEHTEEDASGFSVTGNDEFLAGRTQQSMEGECFYTPEIYALLYPLHANRTEFEIEWQPQGLIDTAREVYHGVAQLFTFNPNAERGTVRVMTCTFRAATEEGFVAEAGT